MTASRGRGVRASLHLKLYAAGAAVLRAALRIPLVRGVLTQASKVWLRQARLLRHLETGGYDEIVDGGASIGEFAALARRACLSVPLVCVEPHPASAQALRRRGFRVVEAALWSSPGRLRLTQPTARATSCTVLGSDEGSRPAWDVDAIRLDQLGVAGRNVLVKLDLQGAEPEALRGMGDLWDRCAGLLLEVSLGDSGTYEPLRRLLGERGFSEAATFNELEAGGRVVEADKLWRRDRKESGGSPPA